MSKKLVSVRQILEDSEDSGMDPDLLFVDPDDIVGLENDPDDEHEEEMQEEEMQEE